VTARAIEALFPGQLDQLCETLAYHFHRAEAAEPAIRYLTMAADRARRTYSNTEAIGYYLAALEQAAERYPEKAAQAQESLGDVLVRVGRNDEGREAYANALGNTPAADPVWRARLHRKTGNTWINVRQADKALSAYASAEAALGTNTPQEPASLNEWLEIQLDVVWAYYWLNQAETMAELLDRIRPFIQEKASAEQRARLYLALVSAAWRRDGFVTTDETLGYARSAVSAADEAGDLEQISWTRSGLGMALLTRGDLEEGKSVLETASEVAERIGAAERQAVSLAYLTLAHRKRRDAASLRAVAQRCIEVGTRSSMPFYSGQATANLAWAAWYDGNLRDAKEMGREAFSLWGAVPNPGVWFAAWPLLAVAWTENDLAEATENARRLLAPPSFRLSPEMHELLGGAISASEAGEQDRSRELLKSALDLAQRTGWL
jgi:hypothetical protein